MNVYLINQSSPQYFTCGNLISNDGFIHERRILDFNVLIFIFEGTLNISLSDGEHSVSHGECIFLKAGEEHFGFKASIGRLSYLWVHFSDDGWQKTDSKPESKSFSYFFSEQFAPPNFQRVGMLFRQLVDFSRQTNMYTKNILTCSLSLLLMEITQEYINVISNADKNISPVIYLVREWIKSNCHRHISLCDIAHEFSYNPEYLSALFKKETGMTIIHFLTLSRIEIAKNLLSSNNAAIKEAAYSSGFRDEKYFMRIFKQYEGITPLQYKNAFHKKSINSK